MEAKKPEGLRTLSGVLTVDAILVVMFAMDLAGKAVIPWWAYVAVCCYPTAMSLTLLLGKKLGDWLEGRLDALDPRQGRQPSKARVKT